MRNHEDSIVNVIYEWTDNDIWDYIKQESLKVNPLYEKGYSRVGCIGCPLASYKQKQKEFADYPQYKKLYIQAFEKMIEVCKQDGTDRNDWESGEDVFNWWIEEGKHNVKGQISMFD